MHKRDGRSSGCIHFDEGLKIGLYYYFKLESNDKSLQLDNDSERCTFKLKSVVAFQYVKTRHLF